VESIAQQKATESTDKYGNIFLHSSGLLTKLDYIELSM